VWTEIAAELNNVSASAVYTIVYSNRYGIRDILNDSVRVYLYVIYFFYYFYVIYIKCYLLLQNVEASARSLLKLFNENRPMINCDLKIWNYFLHKPILY